MKEEKSVNLCRGSPPCGFLILKVLLLVTRLLPTMLLIAVSQRPISVTFLTSHLCLKINPVPSDVTAAYQ